jgi:hypothetical protein
MKKILFILTTFFCPLVFAEDIFYTTVSDIETDQGVILRDTQVRLPGNNYFNYYFSGNLGDSDIFKDIELSGYLFYNNKEYELLCNDLIPTDTEDTFDQSLITKRYEKNRRVWIMSYYLDVFNSGKRETVFKYESFWSDPNRVLNFDDPAQRDWPPVYKDRFPSFGASFFSNSAIVIAGLPPLALINIKKNDTIYTLACKEPEFRSTNIGSVLIKMKGQFNVILKTDGDYIDVYLEDETEKLCVLVLMEEKFIREYMNLIIDTSVDKSKIGNWPRRADGRMDYPPPVDMAGYTATHRTTDSLRLRDAASTASLPVTTLVKGSEVQVLETGKEAAIDGITAPWVKVLSSTGYTGWCFSGYLEPIAKAEEPVAKAEEPPSIPEPIPRTPPPESKAAASLPPPFIIAGASALAAGIVIVITVLKKRKKS